MPLTAAHHLDLASTYFRPVRMLCGGTFVLKTSVGNLPFSAALACAAERWVESKVVGGSDGAHMGPRGLLVAPSSNVY